MLTTAKYEISEKSSADAGVSRGRIRQHWRNFGFIRDVETLVLHLVPLFGTGNSLWLDRTDTEIGACDRSFMPRPFMHSAVGALAGVDSPDWFDLFSLDGLADGAAEILRHSKRAARPGRLDFTREGLEENVRTVI